MARIAAPGHCIALHDIAVTQVLVLASSVTVADSAHDLGVVIDSCLTMADHVLAICRSGYFQLHQLCPVARSLTANAAKMIVHAFVSSIAARQHLRSAVRHQLAVPSHRLSTYGRRAFAIAGPTTWNSLPTHFRHVENSTAAFGRLLKTHLFSEY